MSDVKKETQNSLIASKSSFYFKHSLNDRRQLSLNQNVLLSERISHDCYCRHLQTPSIHYFIKIKHEMVHLLVNIFHENP